MRIYWNSFCLRIGGVLPVAGGGNAGRREAAGRGRLCLRRARSSGARLFVPSLFVFGAAAVAAAPKNRQSVRVRQSQPAGRVAGLGIIT